MPFNYEWGTYPLYQQRAVYKQIAKLVEASPDKELSHEMIEEAYRTCINSAVSVEDDWFHELITEIYAMYAKNGAVD